MARRCRLRSAGDPHRPEVFLLCLLVLGCVIPLHAQTPRITLEQIASGLSQPVFLTSAKDGTNRRFIVEQVGRIRVLQPGSSSSTQFLDISSRVLFEGERGLLGLAFHPQFSINRRFFVNYTRRPDGATVIAEYHASAANPNLADATTETVLLTISQPYENHNGGMIEFGPDGYLYIGMGDGGSGNDPENRAQNLTELLGKMLRIDADRPQSPPPTNPFFGSIPGRDEIFAYGFRNPWRFSFDRLTGQLYVADVGQDAREEIDIVTSGGNYGWRVFEGTRCTNLGPASCTAPGFIPPIAEYVNTGSSGRCSIIGGYVYRGTQANLPNGAYVYGDYCSGEIFMLKDGVQTVLLDTAFEISSFGEDESGEVYVVNLGGSVYRITNPDRITPSTLFSIADRGGFRLSTAGSASALTTGYARIQADQGSPLPAGFAIFGYQQHGVLVSEASVPASPLIRSGRVFAEVNGPVNTGVAIANPNPQDVTVSFFFTDANGSNFGEGATSIPANQQISAFLNQTPFNGSDSVFGTFTFSSALPVSVVALRGFTNERGEFLLTTLPVVPLDAAGSQTMTLAHFADGGGWTTQVVLVNAGDDPIGGTIEFLDPNGQTLRTSAYGLPPRSATRLQTAGSGSNPQVGSVRVSGGANSTVIFSYKARGVTVTQAGVAGLENGTAFRAYVERSIALESGLAIANPSASPITVNLDLSRLDGISTGLTATINIPANGQRALFLTEIPSFASLPTPFAGVLRISSPSPIALTSLRGRTNQRGEFLITTTIPVDESAAVTSSELLFPHFADGGGYAMQFVLFGRGSSGAIYFFNRAGGAVSLFPQ